MKKNIELVKNTIIIFLGKASTQLISILLLPIYTRFLDAGEYGLVDLITTYVTLLVPIVALQLEMGVFRFLVENRGKRKEEEKIISSIFYMLLSLCICFTLLYIVVATFVNFKYRSIVIFNILSTLVYSVSLQVCRGFGDNIKYSIASCISGLVNVILSVLFVIFLKLNGLGVLIAACIGNIIAAIYIFSNLKIWKYIKKSKFSKDKSKEILKYSIPLIPDSVSWWIVNASDRTIISLILSVAENGVYAVANKFSTIYTGIFNVFSLSWNESLSVHIEDSDAEQYINNVYNYYFNIFYAISMIIICAMPIIGNIFITKEYTNAYLHIPILMFAAFINALSTFLSAIYFAKKETKQIAKTSLMGAIINVIVNICLIKFIGLFAADFSTLISYIILFIYRWIDTRKYFKIDAFSIDKMNSIFFAIIMITIYYINNKALNYINALLLFAFLLIANKDKISNIKIIIRRKIKK